LGIPEGGFIVITGEVAQRKKHHLPLFIEMPANADIALIYQFRVCCG